MKRVVCVLLAFFCAIAGLAIAAGAQPGEGRGGQTGTGNSAIDLPGPSRLACESGSGPLSVSWGSVPGASGYQVQIGGVPLEETAGTSLSLGWLPANTRFEFGVRASDGTKWGATATTTCATPRGAGDGVLGQAELVDPPPLRTFFCTDSTPNSLTASWEAVTGASSYKLTASIRINPTTGRIVSTATTTGTSATLTGLSPSTTYIVAVRSINSEGQDGLGIGMICVTPPIVPPPTIDPTPPPPPVVRPPAPSDFGCVDDSETTSGFGVSWTVAPRATAYQVRIGTGGWGTADSSTGHSFSELAAGGEFAVKVRAGNSGGWSPASSATCYTLPVAPVVSCVEGSATTSGFTASWVAVEGADGYQVRIGDDDDDWEAESGTSYAFSELGCGR